MEIQIPLRGESLFNDIVRAMQTYENILVQVSRNHQMKNGNLSIKATLYPAKSAKVSRRNRGTGHEGRLKNAICFHGHKIFMTEIFNSIAGARLRSTMTARVGFRWMNAENFEDVADRIGNLNVGSMMEPKYFIEACEC